MVNCGHQLCSSDDSDWLFSSSAGAPIGGSTNTVELLHSIIIDESNSDFENLSSKGSNFLQSQKICLSVAKERENKYLKNREDRISMNRKFLNSFHDFSEFDETEHFDGCPVKWLYRRQSIDSWRSSSTNKKEEQKKTGEKQKPVTRDKTPREIQIRKMGLRKRQGKEKTKNIKKGGIVDIQDKVISNSETFEEEKRVKLAAKLNFKPFYDEGDDEYSDEEISRFSNFLQPRPLTGQRPWLCILLAPRLDICCTTRPSKEKPPERTRSPTVSIKSLVLPELAKTRPISTPLASSASRWAGQKKIYKPEKELKILQTPPQLVIKLRNIEEADNQTSNSLLEEDRYYRLRRFLNIEDKLPDDTKIVQAPVKKARPKFKSGKDMEIISRKVQFFERPGKPMR